MYAAPYAPMAPYPAPGLPYPGGLPPPGLPPPGDFGPVDQRSKLGLAEQLQWHQQQLARAQEEIGRLRPAEAQFQAITSEVEYLRSQNTNMRKLEERFANVSKEADMLRAQLVKQEHNIDRYTHQTESFYQSANSENIAIKKQLAAREDELRHLRERFTDAVDEINHSHDQVRRAEAELKRVRAEADDLHDFVSEAIYLKHQYGDASTQLARMEDRVESLAAENEHLHTQLEAAEAEVERLSVALGDESTKHRFLEAALNEEIADNKVVRRQLNEAVVHQAHVASAFKSDAVALSSDTQVKTMEIDRLQKRMAEVSAELDKYTAMYQEAVIDVDRLKAALTEEITEHKYARSLADQQKRKADLALEELERSGDCRQQYAQAQAEIGRLQAQVAQLSQRPQMVAGPAGSASYSYPYGGPAGQPALIPPLVSHPQPVSVGYNRADHAKRGASPRKRDQRFSYFGVEVAEGAYLSKNYGEPAPISAVRVVNVGGPCQEAGLRPGDLISSIQGRQVGSLDDFNSVVSGIAPHTDVKIIFERDGVLLGTDIVTEETKREPGQPGRTLADNSRGGRSGRRR
jgi:archaellum component FlaC